MRPTNNAGGLEARHDQRPAARDPRREEADQHARASRWNRSISTPRRSRKPSYERSDVCAVSAASVIVENVVAFEVACALVDKFGGDSLPEMKARYELYLKMAREK